jgi:uncharacterized protein
MPNNLSRAELSDAFIRATSPRHLTLIVSLTEQCTFRCTYCYETFDLGAMPPALFAGLKKYIATTMPGLNTFGLSFYGGEPLIEVNRMIDLAVYCGDQARTHGVTMGRVTIPTNGWSLSRAVLERCVEAGVSNFMVSLDGLGAVHDKTRKLISGRGTFERIYTHLLDARASASDFGVILRLHLHRGNLASQRELVDQLARDFGTDERFYLLPAPLRDYGGDGVASLDLVDEHEMQAQRAELQEVFRRGLSGRPAPYEEQERLCYAARPNNLFIRPDGRIQKCTSSLERDDNTVGRLSEDGTVNVDSSKLLTWAHGFWSGKAIDLRCPNIAKEQGTAKTIAMVPRRQPGPSSRIA